MKRILKMFLVVAMLFCISVIPTKAETSEESIAYAVLTDEGELIFFRSNQIYETSDEKQDVVDINETEYNGIVFTDFESSSSYTSPFRNYINQINSVKVAEGQVIHPVSMYFWFSNAYYLRSFDGTGFDTENVTDMSYLFFECQYLKNVNISSFNTVNVASMDCMFYGCENLKNIDVSHFNTSSLVSMHGMFQDCSALESLDLSSFDTSNVEDMSTFLDGCMGLTEIDVHHFNTTNVKSMSLMFSRCSKLKNIDVSSFNTSNVTNFGAMFQMCINLESVDLSHFDTSKATDMSFMFSSCSQMTELDISSFDTSKVQDMSYMFNSCYSLKSIDVSTFDTSSLRKCDGMFASTRVNSLDLSNFNTSNVLDMKKMFANCRSLHSIDLSSFDTHNVVTMTNMFENCEELGDLKLGSGFTVWNDDTMLPAGNWTHGDLVKTEIELVNEYPSNSATWAGIWSHKPTIKNAFFNEYPVHVTEGNSKQLSITITPENGDLSSLTWSSTDPSIVSVDENGIITGIKTGYAYVTVKAAYSSDSCMIIVDKKQSPHWESNSKGWWYVREDGSYPRNTFELIDNKTYYFDSSGYMVTGWKEINGDYYFFQSSGAMKTSAWESNYYLLDDGKMAKDQWVDGGKYYVDKTGKWHKAHWESNSKGWWYVNEDTTYPTDEFKVISGTTYYFKPDGYMAIGWQKIGDDWYKFKSSGAMLSSCWDGNYYFKEDGKMAVNEWIDDKYYVGEDGLWIPGYGVKGWKKNGNNWWYDIDGYGEKPVLQFYDIEGATYYFDENGFMIIGWKNIDGDYYYFKDSGAMKASAWEGNYWLLDDGKMARNQWVDNGQYFVGDDGAWIQGYGIKGWKKTGNNWWYDIDGYGERPVSQFYDVNGSTYYFDGNGFMITGWKSIDGDYYFFKSSGAMKTSAWEGNYWLLDDGKMARNQWVDSDKYYVDDSGAAIPYPYVASSNSEVYHRWNCPEVNNIKPANLIRFSSKTAAEKSRRPCRVCEHYN